MTLRSCVDPSGRFVFGMHQPRYRLKNLRKNDFITTIGSSDQGVDVDNRANFPKEDLHIKEAQVIYEIPNPFSFKGATFIPQTAADRNAADLERICLPEMPAVSMTETLKRRLPDVMQSPKACADFLQEMPAPLLLALATTSTDPHDLVCLAESCCTFLHDRQSGEPVGLAYDAVSGGRFQPVISDPSLFKAVSNNPWLPDVYKEVMVLRPGAQGGSEITADWPAEGGETHVFEYLRANSYIPWGHYAANMANDAVRYRTKDVSLADIDGMRHLYCQRTYIRLAAELGLALPQERGPLALEELERLRLRIIETLQDASQPPLLTATLWGWNFGFDFTPTGYRLHGSHQQVHQQYALIPDGIPMAEHCGDKTGAMPAYGCGDLIADFLAQYRSLHRTDFFDAYIRAVQTNRRTDGRRDLPGSLVVYEDNQVMLFVPKAQTSQWELQLLCKGRVGNVLEAGPRTRASLNRAMLAAVHALGNLGARMITTIEYPKRFTARNGDQRLLYCFLPKLPYSPGSFTEAQSRWINNHYPEDFARACPRKIPKELEIPDKAKEMKRNRSNT